MARSRTYREGDLFAVPLTDHGFMLGLVLRCDRRGMILGSFFPRRFEQPPQLSDVQDVSPDEVIDTRLFGDLGLEDDGWPVIGRAADFSRERWPMPLFFRCFEGNVPYAVRYDENKLGPLDVVRITPEEVELLPNEDVDGSEYLRTSLTKLLKKLESTGPAS